MNLNPDADVFSIVSCNVVSISIYVNNIQFTFFHFIWIVKHSYESKSDFGTLCRSFEALEIHFYHSFYTLHPKMFTGKTYLHTDSTTLIKRLLIRAYILKVICRILYHVKSTIYVRNVMISLTATNLPFMLAFVEKFLKKSFKWCEQLWIRVNLSEFHNWLTLHALYLIDSNWNIVGILKGICHMNLWLACPYSISSSFDCHCVHIKKTLWKIAHICYAM